MLGGRSARREGGTGKRVLPCEHHAPAGSMSPTRTAHTRAEASRQCKMQGSTGTCTQHTHTHTQRALTPPTLKPDGGPTCSTLSSTQPVYKNTNRRHHHPHDPPGITKQFHHPFSPAPPFIRSQQHHQQHCHHPAATHYGSGEPASSPWSCAFCFFCLGREAAAATADLRSYGAELGAARPTERKRARLSDSDRFSWHRAQKPKYGSPARTCDAHAHARTNAHTDIHIHTHAHTHARTHAHTHRQTDKHTQAGTYSLMPVGRMHG